MITSSLDCIARCLCPLAQVRHFVFEVLQLCAPPFSEQFARALAHLMVCSNLRRTRDGPRGSAKGDLLREFGEACVGLEPLMAQPKEKMLILDLTAA